MSSEDDSPYLPVVTNVVDAKGNPVVTTAGQLARGMSDDNLIEHICGLESFPAGASAELQRRVSQRIVDSTKQLKESVERFDRESSKQSKRMFWLTVVIALLTAVMLLQAFGFIPDGRTSGS